MIYFTSTFMFLKICHTYLKTTEAKLKQTCLYGKQAFLKLYTDKYLRLQIAICNQFYIEILKAGTVRCLQLQYYLLLISGADSINPTVHLHPRPL